MNKILFLSTDVHFKGGIQRYTRTQIKAAFNANLNYEIFSLTKETEVSFGPENYLKNIHFRSGNYWYHNLLFSINFLIKSIFYKPDLIHVNHINLAFLGLISKIVSNSGLVINVYGIEVWSGLSFIKKFSLKYCDHVIGDCEHVVNFLVSKNLVDKSKTSILFDPVDTDKFSPATPNNLNHISSEIVAKDKLSLYTIGRLERNKGHKFIIENISKLPRWNFNIVGDGSNRGELERLVKANNVCEQVFFHGRVEEAQLIECYRRADVVALISSFGFGEGEGLPLGLIEASACSKPILLGSEDGSIEAFCKTAPNGFIINNPSDFIFALTSLESSELRYTYGRNGRDYVVNNFDEKIFCSKFLIVLSSIFK